MKVGWTYTEEGFFCHRGTGFELEPPTERAEEERKRRKLN
jgi:hypothetical protein